MTSSRLVAVAARAWNVLTILVFAGIVALLASGYRATREWEQGVSTRIAHQTEESADLIIKAISRDMHGAQAMILANRDWDAPVPADTADLDITEQVATIFARYPYPESFFTWRGGTHGIIFFSRSTRLPPWMSHQNRPTDSPISTVVDPLIGEHVRQRVLSSIAAQQRYAVFDTQFRRSAVSGRRQNDLCGSAPRTSGIGQRIHGKSRLGPHSVLLRHSQGRRARRQRRPHSGCRAPRRRQPCRVRREQRRPAARRAHIFVALHRLLRHGIGSPAGHKLRHWKLRVSASRDPMLLSAHRRADTTLLATVVAVIICGISLVLARRTVLNDARLSEMRSRFVSSVTHDLKTPLANIHALAATLERESQVTSERYRAISALAHSGSHQPEPAGRQPAGVFQDHRRDGSVCVRADGRCGARRRGAQELSTSAR